MSWFKVEHPGCVTYSQASTSTGYPRIDKSYLLRLPCTKLTAITYKLYGRPRASSTRQWSRAPWLFSQTTSLGHLTLKTRKRIFLLRYKSTWQLLYYPCIKGPCPFLAARLNSSSQMSKPSVEGLRISFRNQRSELTSRLANTYKVTRFDLGVRLLRNIRPSPWSFVRFFVCPSQVTMCTSKYFSFILLFQSWILMICPSQPYVQVDDK